MALWMSLPYSMGSFSGVHVRDGQGSGWCSARPGSGVGSQGSGGARRGFGWGEWRREWWGIEDGARDVGRGS
eukprot:3663155-Rhodomonas_salina.1